MKKLFLILALMIPGVASATCNPFVPNTVLTASALNAAIAGPCITSGTITGAAISGVSIDGSAIGATTPSSVFGTYFKATGLDGSGYSASFYNYGTATSPGFSFNNARGTSTTPSATQAADLLGAIDWHGYSGTSFGEGANINVIAGSTWSSTNFDSYFQINAAASGSTTPSNVANFKASGVSILGTNTNDNAAAGWVGEYVSSTVAPSTTALTTGVPADATSISLSPGDWDVTGSAVFLPAATTNATNFAASINTTSATLGQFGLNASNHSFNGTVFGATEQTENQPVYRLSLSTTTTVYLVCSSNFSVSTMTCGGTLRARRVR